MTAYAVNLVQYFTPLTRKRLYTDVFFRFALLTRIEWGGERNSIMFCLLHQWALYIQHFFQRDSAD